MLMTVGSARVHEKWNWPITQNMFVNLLGNCILCICSNCKLCHRGAASEPGVDKAPCLSISNDNWIFLSTTNYFQIVRRQCKHCCKTYFTETLAQTDLATTPNCIDVWITLIYAVSKQEGEVHMILSDSLCCFSWLRFYLQQFLWRFSCIQIISSPVSVTYIYIENWVHRAHLANQIDKKKG